MLKRALAYLVLLAALAAPASAGDLYTLAGSAARTAPGSGPIIEIGEQRNVQVHVNVTAGSGTVNPFRIWIEASHDGVNFFEVPCKLILKTGAAAPGAGSADQRDIVSEVAAVTSAKYLGQCEVWSTRIRVSWNIAGTTPSETFSVLAYAK